MTIGFVRKYSQGNIGRKLFLLWIAKNASSLDDATTEDDKRLKNLSAIFIDDWKINLSAIEELNLSTIEKLNLSTIKN